MKEITLKILVLLSVLLINACSSDSRVVRAVGFDWLRYNTVVLTRAPNNPLLYGVDLELANKLLDVGYMVIGEKDAPAARSQNRRILLLELVIDMNLRRAIATANFSDYNSGKLLFSVTETVQNFSGEGDAINEIGDALFQSILDNQAVAF